MNPRLFPTLFCLAILAQTAAAQSPRTRPGADEEALRLLRQTIAEQTKNPDKIIPTLNPDTPVVPTPQKPQTPRDAAAAELEQRYLSGRMSQREYEKALARLQLKFDTNAPSASKPAKPSKPPKSGKSPTAASPKAAPGAPTTPEPAIAPPTPQPTERQKKISEVESRLDDMIKAKEARERASQTNQVPIPPGKKLTKREQLDYLLQQVVQGKLSDEDYKKERERIMAQPD